VRDNTITDAPKILMGIRKKKKRNVSYVIEIAGATVIIANNMKYFLDNML